VEVGVFKGSPLVNSTAASFSCLHKHGFQLFEDADREDLAPHNHFPGPTRGPYANYLFSHTAGYQLPGFEFIFSVSLNTHFG